MKRTSVSLGAAILVAVIGLSGQAGGAWAASSQLLSKTASCATTATDVAAFKEAQPYIHLIGLTCRMARLGLLDDSQSFALRDAAFQVISTELDIRMQAVDKALSDPSVALTDEAVPETVSTIVPEDTACPVLPADAHLPDGAAAYMRLLVQACTMKQAGQIEDAQFQNLRDRAFEGALKALWADNLHRQQALMNAG